MEWINLEAVKKLTTERPKNIYLQFKQSVKKSILDILNIWDVIFYANNLRENVETDINKPPCSEVQRCFIIVTIANCIFNPYIMIINTHFYHKQLKGTFNITNIKTIIYFNWSIKKLSTSAKFYGSLISEIGAV